MTAAFKWLYPGLKIKRWISLVILGFALLIIGLAGLGVHFGHKVPLPGVWALIGAIFIIMGLTNTIKSIISALLPGSESRFIDMLYRRRFLERGEQLVVVGGGTGLSTMLRGLKRYTSNITAIVTVADDGGSSGRLRREMGMLPPGDIRNCLVALADTESLMSDLFRYRFKGGEFDGHSFGNLFIATLNAVAGDFETAVKLSSKVLAIRGQVLPSTLSNVTLKAIMSDGRVIEGESKIGQADGVISSIKLVPPDARPLTEAVDAIGKADVIVLGPGSLYTSIIPNLLVSGITDAIKRSKAFCVYICNVMTQPGETTGYSVTDHVDAIRRAVGNGVIDYVLVNVGSVDETLLVKYRLDGAELVRDDSERLIAYGIKVVRDDLVSQTEVVRHDPDKLAVTILGILAKHQAKL